MHLHRARAAVQQRPVVVAPRYDGNAGRHYGLTGRDPAGDVGAPPRDIIVEAWANGFLLGALLIMATLTIANMRRGVLLHKLILLELVLGIWQSFYIFFDAPASAWVLSVGAIPLNVSWSLHNVVAWLKLRPFLGPWASALFIGSFAAAQPYWAVEIVANFGYFHDLPGSFAKDLFPRTRPLEALFRDPWWLAAAVLLLRAIRRRYQVPAVALLRASVRFTLMLAAVAASVVFIVVDVLSVTGALPDIGRTVGLNPWWKLAFVFKCLADAILLDDFKTILDRLWDVQLAEMARLHSCEAAPPAPAGGPNGSSGGGGGIRDMARSEGSK